MSAAARPAVLDRLRSSAGFTLIEVMIAAMVMVVGVLGTVSLVDQANASATITSAREGATNLIRDVVETAREVPYSQLTPSTITTQIQQRGLADAHPEIPGWQIDRRGITYTVTAQACSVDDPSDGVWVNAGTTGLDPNVFCADSVANDALATPVDQYGNPAAKTDYAPDDYKRVQVTVSWAVRGHQYSTSQTTIVNNPGDSLGPRITSITGQTYFGLANASMTSATYTATLASPAVAVNWLVNGTIVHQDVAANGETSSSFTWSFGALGTTASATPTLDGVYTISAQAFDSANNASATQFLTVTLNRRQPFAPTNFAGGLNGTFGDFEWEASAEGDIVGYRVYRISNNGSTGSGTNTPGTPNPASDTQICPAAGASPSYITTVSCIDPSPPALTPLYYYVVALDRDDNHALRVGDTSPVLTVVPDANPPLAPTGLTVKANGDGTSTLSWTVPGTPGNPASEDADPGDSISFYRIYRDGQAVAERYDRTANGTGGNPGNTITYVDGSTGGTQHSYWVTAVDTHYNESTETGPVTG